MRILTRNTLKEYALNHPDVSGEIWAIYADMVQADWRTATDVKAYDSGARYVGGNRWIFNLLRNRYRLVVKIMFPASSEFVGRVYVRFLGTHAEYDRITNIETI